MNSKKKVKMIAGLIISGLVSFGMGMLQQGDPYASTKMIPIVGGLLLQATGYMLFAKYLKENPQNDPDKIFG